MITALVQIEPAARYFLMPARETKPIYVGNRRMLELVLVDSKPDDIIATMGTDIRCVVQTDYSREEIFARLERADKMAYDLNKLNGDQ